MFNPLKYIAFSTLLISFHFCSGQSVRFQFYRTKACSVIEELDTAYSLYKIPGSLDTEYTPKAGTVYLPGIGRYNIFAYGPELDTVFDIRDTGLFVFRFKEPDHGLYVTGGVDVPALYSRCDSLLQGYQEYHYPNGGLEMRGTFKNGFRQDSIITFYRNGKVEKSVKRYPKVIVVMEFDSLGNKIGISRNQNISFMAYGEYHRTAFYPDGSVKRKESSVKRVIRIKAYYPNGRSHITQTKRYRTEYYDSGLKKITYTWNHKYDHITDSKNITVCKTEYDANGRMLKKMIYKDWGYLYAQPHFNIQHSDWIVSIEKFEGANKVFSVSDMDTKEFMKKYPNELPDEERDDNQ